MSGLEVVSGTQANEGAWMCLTEALTAGSRGVVNSLNSVSIVPRST